MAQCRKQAERVQAGFKPAPLCYSSSSLSSQSSSSVEPTLISVVPAIHLPPERSDPSKSIAATREGFRSDSEASKGHSQEQQHKKASLRFAWQNNERTLARVSCYYYKYYSKVSNDQVCSSLHDSIDARLIRRTS